MNPRMGLPTESGGRKTRFTSNGSKNTTGERIMADEAGATALNVTRGSFVICGARLIPGSAFCGGGGLFAYASCVSWHSPSVADQFKSDDLFKIPPEGQEYKSRVDNGGGQRSVEETVGDQVFS
jgi:hypothetical protein